MNADEIENLYLRSLDEPLKDSESQQLNEAIAANASIFDELFRYKQMRESVLRTGNSTFGPYFAQKVIHRIQNLRVDIDQQIVFFFRKYQLAALGVLIALLAVNVIFADSLDLPSLLGIEQSTAPSDDDLLTFDFYENITNN